MSLTRSDPGHRAAALAEALAHLPDDTRNPSRRLLLGLSDLSLSELGPFKDTWNYLPVKRKRAVLSCLKKLAEDQVACDFGAVFKHALGDADDTVRQKAIAGLWENEEPSLIRPLLDILAHDNSSAVREAAASALGRFTVLAECRKIEASHAAPLGQSLLVVANNPAEPLPLRGRALEALAPLSLAGVTQAIWAAYRCEEPEMRTYAIRAMGLNRDPLWLPTIIQELAGDRAVIRCAAAAAAGALGEPEGAAPLAGLLDDPDPEVRLTAVRALGDIGGVEARRTLGRLLEHEDPSLRNAAASALAEMDLFEEPLAPHGQG